MLAKVKLEDEGISRHGRNTRKAWSQHPKSTYENHGITPKRVTSGGIHLRGLAPGRHSSEEISQRWRVVGDTVSDLTAPGFEPQIFRTDSNVLHKLTGLKQN